MRDQIYGKEEAGRFMTDVPGCLGQCREAGRFMTDVHGCLGQFREAGRFMADVHGCYICHEPACFTALS
jgi:hypothetical protein